MSTHCQCPVFAVIAPLTRNKQYGNDDLLNCDEDDIWERLALGVWGEFMELYLSCKWIPGLRNTSGELVVNWPESCPRSAEHPHSHNFILLDFLIYSWFTFSFTQMYLNFYGPFKIQITEDRDIWRKCLKYFKEAVGEIKHFPKVTAIFLQIIFLDCPPIKDFCNTCQLHMKHFHCKETIKCKLFRQFSTLDKVGKEMFCIIPTFDMLLECYKTKLVITTSQLLNLKPFLCPSFVRSELFNLS